VIASSAEYRTNRKINSRPLGKDRFAENLLAMKISILTAVWNREATVGDALDSLVAQRFADWEHVVQDGGSSDGTLALIERRADPRRAVESGRDDGIYDALNRAFVRCHGDIVGLLHSDDFFAHAGVLEQVAAAFARTDADAVYGDLDYVSNADPSQVIRHWRAGEYRPDRLGRGWMPPHPTLFLHRRVIERLGGYDTSFRIAADYDAILRYFGAGGISSAYIPDVLVKMRVGGESNRSFGRIVRKSGEDYRALRKNGVGGFGTLIWKNLSKVGQFVQKV
jgi:glycosyltransferase involved in cell wall biosynthesis